MQVVIGYELLIGASEQVIVLPKVNNFTICVFIHDFCYILFSEGYKEKLVVLGNERVCLLTCLIQ